MNYPKWAEILMAIAAAVQAVFAFAIWRFQRAIEETRSRVELVPIIQLTPAPADPPVFLSIGNATPNGCRVVRVKLFMERASPSKEEEERKLDHICAVSGSGIIPGFGTLQVDLIQPVRELLRAVAFVPGEPGSKILSRLYTVRLWAEVEYVAGQKKDIARSDRYISYPHSPTGKDAPTSLVNLELETPKRV
jgi:hypothetical protein